MNEKNCINLHEIQKEFNRQNVYLELDLRTG